MGAQEILLLDGLTKAFGDTRVLRGITLSVKQGEFLTLLGPSGCGKTTTLRIIAGLTAPDSGCVRLKGQDVTALPPEKRSVNTVFQNYALFPHMNVEKNIAYGLRMRGASKAEQKQTVREMLSLIQLEGYEKRMPDQLSGGQRQRVAIARAVALKPDILLLDEPLGALDLKLRQQMQKELKELQVRLGMTFIYITHDQEEALNMSDRIAVMNEGMLEQVGTPEDIYERPQTRFTAQFIGQGALISGSVGKDGRVLLPFGEAMADTARFHEGEKVLVSVHAERIRFSDAPQDGFALPARVQAVRYAGAMRKCDLIMRDGTLLTALFADSAAELPREGAEVFVHWRPSHAALIAQEDRV